MTFVAPALVKADGQSAFAGMAAAAPPQWVVADTPRVKAAIQAAAVRLLDATGELTFSEAVARFSAGEGEAAAATEIMPMGSGRAVWYQLRLPAVQTPARLVLSVPHPGMDSVDLYRALPSTGGPTQWVLQRSGDTIPVADWPVQHLYPAFDMVVQPGDFQPAYLRVAHNYPISVRWTLTDFVSFQEKSECRHLLLGIYLGVVLLMVMVSCIHAASWRDSIHLFYAGYVAVLALGTLSLTGLAGEYLWPHSAWWNDHAPNTLALAGAALLHLLLRQLVADRGASPLSWWLLFMTAVGAVIALGFVAVGRNPFMTFTPPYYLASMATYLGVGAWQAWRSPRVGLWIAAAMACLVGGAAFPLLRVLGLMEQNDATQYGAQIGASLEIVLLFLALYFRSHQKRDNQRRITAMPRVDPLTGVGSHAVLLKHVERLLLRQQREPGAGAVLRVRLSNAIDIRQEYGMEAGQRAVVHASACITALAGEGDAVARHRDGDFVLVLRRSIRREELAAMGQQLIVRGLAKSPALLPTITLQFRVAVAEAPFRAKDATDLLHLLGGVLQDLPSRQGTALRFLSWPEAPEEPPARPALVDAQARHSA